MKKDEENEKKLLTKIQLSDKIQNVATSNMAATSKQKTTVEEIEKQLKRNLQKN